jgi:integrase
VTRRWFRRRRGDVGFYTTRYVVAEEEDPAEALAITLVRAELDEAAGVLRIHRKQVRRHVGPLTRKKRAPKEIPLVAELASILQEQRQMLVEKQAPGLAEGWLFPSETGTLRVPSSLQKAWPSSLKAAGIKAGSTVHGLRRTFNDLARRRGCHARHDGARDRGHARALLDGGVGRETLRDDQRDEAGAWRTRGGGA